MKLHLPLLLVLSWHNLEANFLIICNQLNNLKKVIIKSESFSSLTTPVIEAAKALEEYNYKTDPKDKIVVLKLVTSTLQPVARNYLCNPISPVSQEINDCYNQTIYLIKKDCRSLVSIMDNDRKQSDSYLKDLSNQSDYSDDDTSTESESEYFYNVDHYRLTDSFD